VNEFVANDKLGAFCRDTHVEVGGAAHGPLQGLTFAVKDIYDIAGHRTGFGSPDWLRTHDPAAPTARAEDIARAKTRREEIARRLAELLEGPTVLALPSVPGIAVPRNSPPEVLDDLRVRALALLCIAGLARLPQISLPLATLDGCPLGLSLIAAQGNDTLLLELAASVL
jgi:Asp-tRNA(Asn)/Glu-tRNA(Gln) amidotransferase A subunit family amidase